MAVYDVDYGKWDRMECEAEEDKKLELDFEIDSDGEPPQDEIGDIRNIIRNKNEKIVRKEIMKVGDGLEKPGKPYIVTVHAMGYTKSEFLFLPMIQNISMTLGDLRLPTGLWKSIEHMKKGECAKIWIKPGEYGFAREKHADVLQWPDSVKDNEELKQKLKDEEIFYEIELIDWIVRSDLLGTGELMKTYEVVAEGYDRCGEDDEVIFDYTISKITADSQFEKIDSGDDEKFSMIDSVQKVASSDPASDAEQKLGAHEHHYLNPSIDLMNNGKFTYVMKKILKSMKLGEKSSTVVQYSWLQKHDIHAIEKYQLKENERLKLDLNFKNMVHIQDFYNDGTVYKKLLKKGKGTASPLSDSIVKLQLKVAYNKLSEDEEEEVLVLTDEPVEYELDGYMIPPLLRNILKSLKLREVIEIHTILKDELIPEFEDEVHGLFKKEWYDKVGEIDPKTGRQRWIVFTLEMTDFDTPESMHALYIAEKAPRLLRFKNIATKFFKAQNWPKA